MSARSLIAAMAIAGVCGCTAKESSQARDTASADTAAAVGGTDLGRDSAYGPIGTMDEKGNIEPIKK